MALGFCVRTITYCEELEEVFEDLLSRIVTEYTLIEME